ncbi:tRNA-dihydrouridine synthase family protein [bacterium]|nr:tRNA-dihydrouridine synthase family protein [bacterium]
MKDCFFMSPVKGITDLTYRNCFADHFSGVDIALTPFVDTVKGNIIKPSKLQEYDPAINRLKIIPQVIGKNPEHLKKLISQLKSLGNTEVNINFGCPHPLRTKKKTGSGLLPYPEEIDELLNAIFKDVNIDISIKIRLGMKNQNELLKLIPILNRYKLKSVVIHPRTALQGYGGETNLDMFKECYSKLNHHVVYNGDIVSVDSFFKFKNLFPEINSWMIGRGLLSNPFLIEKIKSEVHFDESKIQGRITSFHNQLLNDYSKLLSGDSHILQRMICHWNYLQTFIPDSTRFFKKLGRIKSLKEYKSYTNSILS